MEDSYGNFMFARIDHSSVFVRRYAFVLDLNLGGVSLDANNNEKEICRYNLSEDGKNNTAIIFADLYREGEEWNFSALGELKQSSIRSLYNSYKG